MAWVDGAGAVVRVLLQADAVRLSHGISGVASEEDVDRVIEAHGITVHERHPFVGRVKGLLIDDHIFIRSGLRSGERAAIKAHELGHFVLHDGNGLYLKMPKHRLIGHRRERQAQLFAGALILGSPAAARLQIKERIFEASENGVPTTFICSYASAIVAEFGILLA